MKRMVKNGNLLDVSENGSGTTFGGNLKVGGTIIANGEIRGGDVSASKFYLGTEEMPLVKANPTGEATQTLEKVKIGDVAYNVGGGGGSDYTAGSNIEISAAKEIALKSALTGVENISFTPNDKCKISGENGEFHIKSSTGTFGFPIIDIDNNDNAGKSIKISFYSDYSKEQFINFSTAGYNGNTAFCMLTRGNKVPQVPTDNGTYVLKATVSGGTVTYTWEPQA